jgi:hypothetical protein
MRGRRRIAKSFVRSVLIRSAWPGPLAFNQLLAVASCAESSIPHPQCRARMNSEPAMPLPNSLGWMESVDAKLARAREHVKSLEQAVADYIASSEREIILKLNPDQTVVSLMTWSKDPYPPIRIRAIVGDCLFNIRAALDNLVCGLVRRKTPADDCRARSFPILTSVAKWKDPSDALRGVEADAKRVIKECQPFNRPPASIEIDPLNILNVLRNRDTHRAALLTSGFSANTEFLIHTKNGRLLHVKSDQPMLASSGSRFRSRFRPPPSEMARGSKLRVGRLSPLETKDRGVIDLSSML